MFDHVPELVSIFALDPPRHASTARIIRHQDDVAPCKTDEGREGSAFGSALVLVDLDDDFLAFFQGVLDPGAANVDTASEIGAGDLFEGEEAVALGAVIDKCSLEARLDAGDDTLVDVALALFLGGGLDIEVDEPLSIDDGDAQLFGLRRIKQHAFHYYLLPRSRNTGWANSAA